MPGFSTNSADRCLAIIELLALEQAPMSVTDIASQTRQSPSVTHRLLAVLRDRGYVSQDQASEQYNVSLRFGALAARVLSGKGVIDVCRPVLDDLAAKSRELARFSVLEGGRLIWVGKAQGSLSSVRYDPIDGQSVLLHATAMGKAWLSTLPEHEAIGIVAAQGFASEMAGPNIIRTEAALRGALREARDLGYGLVVNEAEPDVSGIAVVVRDELDAKRPAVGCLSVGGPSQRLDRARLVKFLPDLHESALRIGRSWFGVRR